MASKPNPFFGKESKKEESSEKRVGKKAYATGEKREGIHGAKRAAVPFNKGGKVKC